MDKNYEAIKEILEEQIKKIVKKGDISQQELDNLTWTEEPGRLQSTGLQRIGHD